MGEVESAAHAMPLNKVTHIKQWYRSGNQNVRVGEMKEGLKRREVERYARTGCHRAHTV